MIAKKVRAQEGIRPDELVRYITDGKHAEQGQECGPKVAFAAALNCVSDPDDLKGATAEMCALGASYCEGKGDPFAHWIYSTQKGETITPAQAIEIAQIHLKNQGMSGHPAILTVHNNTEHPHVHIAHTRVSPEPEPDGRYHIVWRGASVQSKNGNNEKESAHKALAEIVHRQGRKLTGEARYVWDSDKNEAVKVQRQTAVKPDEIKLGQRVESWEAREGHPHPKRVMAEAALAVIRAAGQDKALAVAALMKAGIDYVDVDYLDAKGRRHQGGKLTGPDGAEVKLSSLPKDCRFLSNKSNGKFTPYDGNMHDGQGKVNAFSEKVQGTGGQHAPEVNKKSLVEMARSILPAGKTEEQTRKTLAEQGISLTVEIGIDRKTGKEFRYGKLSREGEQPISLRQLGSDANGKPLFSISGLEKGWRQAEFQEARMQLARDFAAVVDGSRNWREAETALPEAGIAYNRVKTTIKDKDGTEKEIIVGRLSRNGIETTTGLAGRDYQPAAIDARYRPEAQARSLYMEARTQAQPVQFLAAKGLTASDIDRIGRVGEKTERALQRNEKQASTPAPQATQAQPVKSIIPKNINEIFDLLEESGKQAAALAQANARAGQQAALARRAQAQAEQAENALAELKSSIKREQPDLVEPKEKVMATSGNTRGTGGAALAPESQKPAQPEAQDVKKSQAAADSDRAEEKNKAPDRVQAMDREKEREREREQAEKERARERERAQAARERERARHRM